MKILEITSLSILAIFYFQCRNSINESLDSTLPESEPELIAIQDTFFSVLVDNLRMRTAPHLNDSEVVTQLKQETDLVYQHEKTDFLSTITIGGKKKEEPWYKVSTRDGQYEGWVYGGGIQMVEGVKKEEFTLTPERLVYSIENGTEENLEAILDLSLPGSNKRFKGFYEYKPGLAGNRILDGSIRLESRQLIEATNVEREIHIEGRYRNGKKDGAFICRYYYPESEGIATLYFEETQEKCLWGFYYETGEGEKSAYREDQLTDCSFDILREKARSSPEI